MTRGRKLGVKNRQGHNAGGARPGSGRKSQEPEQSTNLANNTNVTMHPGEQNHENNIQVTALDPINNPVPIEQQRMKEIHGCMCACFSIRF
jgi:hypothetical protein